VQPDRLQLVVTTRAEPDQLLRMFELDRHLSETSSGPVGLPGIELLWRRR
jgi:hypothetical protein